MNESRRRNTIKKGRSHWNEILIKSSQQKFLVTKKRKTLNTSNSGTAGNQFFLNEIFIKEKK
jgi:hypothetical protein